MSHSPGFVGKIPSQGDFISRRLPWDFIECWDNWLQSGVASARDSLGAAWLDTYLVAPVWRFLITPGACGNHGWLGLWFPSVDRVGRHFPFTVTVPIPAHQAHPGLLFSQEAWLAQIEAAALQALDPRVSLEQLDMSLARLPLVLPDSRTPPSNSPVATRVYTLPEGLHADALARIIPAVASSPKQPVSYWHTWGSDQVEACYYVSERLPDSNRFAAYLTGEWAQFGLQPDSLTVPGSET
jgi:type VI secretion system protein ImpM